jgi:phospholipase/lecithinase/hemolysin
MRYQRLLSAVLASFAAIAIGAVSSPARADHGNATFDTLYVFGDSSSDDGNFFAEYGTDMHPTFAIYYPTGAFTNGHVWANYLVNSGVADVQDNRAFSGAMTGTYGEPARMDPLTGPLPTGLRTQIDNFAGEIGENDLVGVWVGFNDYLFGAQFGMDNAPSTVVGNIAEAVVRLDGLGARHILVFNLPDLSRVPLASFLDPAQARQLGTASAVHNALLAASISTLRLQLDAEIVVIDIFAAMSQIVGYPERFGFTNATDSCLLVLADGQTTVPNPYSPCLVSGGETPYNPFDDVFDPTGFVFWDLLHPTTAAHQVLADFTAATLASHAFGSARYGSSIHATTSNGGAVFMCADPADGLWCY